MGGVLTTTNKRLATTTTIIANNVHRFTNRIILRISGVPKGSHPYLRARQRFFGAPSCAGASPDGLANANERLTFGSAAPNVPLMKQILSLMAEYNGVANGQLYALLEKSDPEVLTRESGSYYGNILGLANHILVADLDWLRSYRDGNLDIPVLRSPVLDFEHPGWRKNLYHNFDELKTHRETTDALFVKFVGATPAELFDGPIEVTRGRRNRTIVFPFGKILMHLFNHQTHHRGAIAQILDQNDIENDYSNISRLLAT